MSPRVALFSLSVSLLIGVADAQGGRGRPAGPEVLRALDANGDGALSAEEIANAATALKTLDRDGDGVLSSGEIGGPGGGRAGRGEPRPAGARGVTPAASLEKPPLANGEAEERAFAVLDALDADRRGNMNVPLEDGRLLRMLTESVGAKQVVEIGTSNGYSGIWFCLALNKTGGKLITHEIDPRRANMARENFAKAGVEDLVTIVEGDAHETVQKLEGPIDVAFIDADKPGYHDYLEKLLPKMRPGGLICAHNMSRSMADPDFVRAITTDPRLDTLFLHMDGAGMAVTIKKR